MKIGAIIPCKNVASNLTTDDHKITMINYIDVIKYMKMYFKS